MRWDFVCLLESVQDQLNQARKEGGKREKDNRRATHRHACFSVYRPKPAAAALSKRQAYCNAIAVQMSSFSFVTPPPLPADVEGDGERSNKAVGHWNRCSASPH